LTTQQFQPQGLLLHDRIAFQRQHQFSAWAEGVEADYTMKICYKNGWFNRQQHEQISTMRKEQHSGDDQQKSARLVFTGVKRTEIIARRLEEQY
jgi:hypothetical protein